MYIKRELEKNINDFLYDKEILAVIGSRQVGKTTLINKCLDKLKDKNINRLSFDDLEISMLFKENIKAFIEKYVKGYDIVFIDEIQYIKDSGQKLKFIYDTIDKVKLIISGSSATEMSIQSIKYLVGRIIVFELQTLSFKEFLRYKDEKLYNICVKQLFSSQIIIETNRYIVEYILFGGYPRVVLENNLSKKKEILKNIFNTYLLKEISEILKYKNIRVIEKLVKFLASQIGGIINYQDLSAKVDISIYEIKNALYILEKTFICSYASNYHSNKQTELVKSPKVFFYDLGLRNVVLNLFEEDAITGNMYENFIASQLIRNNIKLKYWKTKSHAEVDFIIENGIDIKGIEVKSYLKKDVVEKSMRSFIEKYKPTECIILSKSYKNKREINNIGVLFLPYIIYLFKV